MKYQIVLVLLLSFFAIGARASGYTCTAWGTSAGEPGPGHPHGKTYSQPFDGSGASQNEASQSALSQCRSAEMESCRLDECRELVLLPPRPLGPDTEISCADDSGIQVEVLVGPQRYHRTAVVSKNNVQVAAFGLTTFTPSDAAAPTQYESESSVYNLQLSLPNSHLFVNGPNLYSDGFVRCIRKAPVQPAPSPRYPHCTGSRCR
jgi:hypothetical protein